MKCAAVLLLVASTTVYAAEYRTGQAARAVIGQSSFGAHEAGVKASSLVISGDRLYAADESQGVLTFDLSRLGSVRDDRAQFTAADCAVCEAAPLAQTKQSVMPGVAAVSVWGKTVAVADALHHRVLIWRDATAARLDRGPDVILGRADQVVTGPAALIDPVSVALDGKRLFVGDAALHRVLVWNTLPANGDQLPDAVLGQRDFFHSAAPDSPAANTIGIPAALASNGNDVFVADASANRILVFSPADTALARESVINSASLSNGPLAPGTLITIQGSRLSDVNDSAPSEGDAPLPRKLGGVEVIFDGVALPVLSVSPEEVQAQLPYDLGGREEASVYVRTERARAVRVTNAVNVKLVAANPGLFALGGSEPRTGILLHRATKSAEGGAPPVTEDNPARPGEVVTVWATGLGALLDDEETVAVPLTAQINGQLVPVVSAKLAAHAAGVYEVSIAVPAAWRRMSRARLALSQNGLSSNTITFPLGPPLR